MKSRFIALGVALALAFSPLVADAGSTTSSSTSSSRSSGGFSSPSSSRSMNTETRSSHGFSSANRTAQQPTVKSDESRSSGGFSMSKPSIVNTAPPSASASQDTKRSANGFSSGSSAPAAQAPAARTANGFTAGGAGAAAGSAATVSRSPQAQPSAVDRLAAKSQSQAAFAQFKREQAAYKAPPVAPPVNQAAARSSGVWNQYGSKWNDPNAYARERQTAFDRQPDIYMNYYQRPPSYIRSAAYGAIAGGFLALMLDRATDPGYASWAYSHQNDTGYMEWHRDMMDQARDNAELREKLARLDQQVADMKAKDAPITTALPQGIDPSFVVAPETAAMATTPDEPAPSHIFGTIVKWLAIVGFVVIAFIGACIFISQRQRRAA